MAYRIAPTVKQLLLAQCISGCALFGVLLIVSWQAAYSAFIGSMIAFIPNAWLALRVFNMSKGRSAQSTLRAFYSGAAGKFIVTVALFIITFKLVAPLNVLALFAGFIVVQLTHWITPLLTPRKRI